MFQLPQDKANHFIYGALVFVAIFFVAHLLLPVHAIGIALGATVVVGVAKELLDMWSNYKAKQNKVLPKHGVELWDAVATIAGGVVVALPLCVKLLV